ncbi:armadillo-type protein [Mycena galericulata]|nr:armadillo-type protein [Mycena galericulata]
MLQSWDAKVREWSCRVVERLADHKSTAPAVAVESGLCVQLLARLRDDNADVRVWALHAWRRLAGWPDGARAAVDANVQDYFAELLEFGDARVRKASCWLVETLAGHPSIASPILDSATCDRLVSLLRDEDSIVTARATDALRQIAKWEDGAQAVVKANALEYVQELFDDSTRAMGPESACQLLGNLASHTSTASAVLDLDLFPRLISLLQSAVRLENSTTQGTRTSATFALARLSNWPIGVAALSDADVLESLQKLKEYRRWFPDLEADIHTIQENIARYKAELDSKELSSVASIMGGQQSSRKDRNTRVHFMSCNSIRNI